MQKSKLISSALHKQVAKEKKAREKEVARQ